VLEAAKSEPLPTHASRSSPAMWFTRGRRELIDRAVDRFGGVDVLVNSTGIFRVTTFLEQTEEQFEEALTRSSARPTTLASGRAQDGRARRRRDRQRRLDVALDAIATTPTSAYSAAQAGRHAVTKNLAIELAGANIRVNTVALAFVDPAYERFMTAQEARRIIGKRVPSARSSRLSGRCR
jgi:NAD(P)-dependent dehydrogenase (short-subunit alcohol dehydrogenase family)